jgi:hypothetical protein
MIPGPALQAEGTLILRSEHAQNNELAHGPARIEPPLSENAPISSLPERALEIVAARRKTSSRRGERRFDAPAKAPFRRLAGPAKRHYTFARRPDRLTAGPGSARPHRNFNALLAGLLVYDERDGSAAS